MSFTVIHKTSFSVTAFLKTYCSYYMYVEYSILVYISKEGQDYKLFHLLLFCLYFFWIYLWSLCQIGLII